MRDFLKETDVSWLEDTWQRLEKKLCRECERMGERIPYLAEDGAYQKDLSREDISWWTNGFWGGILWQMYHATGKESYRNSAEKQELLLDQALKEYEFLYHDVGFMWMHTAVADYRLTGSHASFVRGQHAANLLAGRYNPQGKFIRAWNDDKSGWMIVDCLMNLSLLYWASEESRDPRFELIAKAHADTALEKILRGDGSCNHIVVIDPWTGELDRVEGGQGYEVGSSWSRGQAWAVYGFAISYSHTGEKRYLDAAKQVAHYFMANAALSDYLTLCDFRAPREPVYYDSTAGACAVCGLLEIARHVPDLEKPLYEQFAVRMLRAMEKEFCNWNPDEDGILGMGKVAYHENEVRQPSIIYGDYFFTEAVLRLLEKDFFIW